MTIATHGIPATGYDYLIAQMEVASQAESELLQVRAHSVNGLAGYLHTPNYLEGLVAKITSPIPSQVRLEQKIELLAHIMLAFGRGTLAADVIMPEERLRRVSPEHRRQILDRIDGNGGLSVRLVPFAAADYSHHETAFSLIQAPGSEPVLTFDTPDIECGSHHSVLYTGKSTVSQYEKWFEHIKEVALSKADSRQLIASMN